MKKKEILLVALIAVFGIIIMILFFTVNDQKSEIQTYKKLSMAEKQVLQRVEDGIIFDREDVYSLKESDYAVLFFLATQLGGDDIEIYTQTEQRKDVWYIISTFHYQSGKSDTIYSIFKLENSEIIDVTKDEFELSLTDYLGKTLSDESISPVYEEHYVD